MNLPVADIPPSPSSLRRFERGASRFLAELPFETTEARQKRLASLGKAAGSLVHMEHGHDLAHPETSLRLLGVASMKIAAIDWLSSKMTVDELYGCWALPIEAEFDDKKRARYPVVNSAMFQSSGEVAHRFVMRRVVGPLETDEVLDHVCRNHACCNPLHLDIVTQGVNVMRGATARRSSRGQMPLL